jgi:trigger factor
MNTTIARLEDGTIELTMTVPWAEISKTYELVVEDMVKDAEISGFRKGKAPRKMVEDGLDKTKVYEEAIRRIVPQVYSDAITEQKITPILMPQIELKEAQEGKDWVVQARTCEAPKVTLGDYKKAIKEAKANKAAKIIVPGKEKDAADNKPNLDDVLGALLGVTQIKLPTILVEHETNHQLSQLIDQTKKLGLSVEQYLASTGKTSESIRADYAQQTQRTLTLEFALEAAAVQENVKVEDADIAKLLATAKSDEERKSLEKEQYYLTTLVKRQKTVDLLMAL